MHLRWIWSTILLIAVLSPTAFCDEVIERLEAARQHHEETLAEAQAKITAAYRELIIEANAAGNANEANTLSSHLKFFEERGGIIMREDLNDAYLEYGKTVKASGDELREAYTSAMKAKLEQGDSNAVDELQNQLDASRLPVDLVSFSQSANRDYIMHGDYLGFSKPARSLSAKMNGTWEVVSGLASKGLVSIRSPNVRNFFLAHGGYRIRLQPYQDSVQFKQNATFRRHPGLFGRGRGASFESVNLPNHYIRRRANGELWLDKNDGSVKFKKEATFFESKPLMPLW